MGEDEIILSISDLLTIGNIIMFLSNIPAIRAVIKDRSIIAGYSIIGTFLTICGMLIFDIWYIIMGYYLPLVISFFTDVYWILAFYFSLKRKLS